MAAESKDQLMRRVVGEPHKRARVEAVDGIMEVELPPELLKGAMAAANACGQTVNEWICEALTEAVERKSRREKSKEAYKQ